MKLASLRWILTAAGLLGTAVPAFAGEGTLEERLQRLSAELEQRRQDRHIPGMVFALVKDDQIVLAEGFGLRDVEQQKPVWIPGSR